MSPEDRKRLDEAVELSRENNKILHGMRRSARLGAFFRIVYWAIILGGLAVSYQYLKPYLELMTKTYTQVQKQYGGLQNSLDKLPDLNKLLNQGGNPR